MRSIKRRMGSQETVMLGGKSLTPPEISAVILRELVDWWRVERDRFASVPEKAVVS